MELSNMERSADTHVAVQYMGVPPNMPPHAVHRSYTSLMQYAVNMHFSVVNSDFIAAAMLLIHTDQTFGLQRGWMNKRRHVGLQRTGTE